MVKLQAWLSLEAMTKTALSMSQPSLVSFVTKTKYTKCKSSTDDKMLMVWDLHPSLHIVSPNNGREGTDSIAPDRPQPTAYPIAFVHPLTSVNSHPFTSKEFLVSDCRGSVFLTDWRSDPDDTDQDGTRHSSVIELVEPRALSEALTGISSYSGLASSAAWRRDNTDM